MQLFYATLQRVLEERGDASASVRIAQHISARRKPVAFMCTAVEHAGFRVTSAREDRFSLQFSCGAALFDHAFVRAAFLGPWLQLAADHERAAVFGDVQARLDAAAHSEGKLVLDVPFACVDATRV